MSSTLEQARAKHAHQQVIAAEASLKDDAAKKELGREAKRMPVRILTSGLGAALLFLRAKDRAKRLEDALSDWIAVRYPPKAGHQRGLLERITEGDAVFLQLATAEALAYLQWYSRFAEAKRWADAND